MSLKVEKKVSQNRYNGATNIHTSVVTLEGVWSQEHIKYVDHTYYHIKVWKGTFNSWKK